MDLNNFLISGFKFVLSKTPNFAYNVQKVQMPGINLGTANVPTPFTQIPLPGNIAYEDLSIEFMVAESLVDYLEIFNWIVRMGQPVQFGQQEVPFRNNMTDASLVMMNSASRPMLEAKFYDLYPTNLSGLNFDTTVNGTQYVSATANFKFLRYDIAPYT